MAEVYGVEHLLRLFGWYSSTRTNHRVCVTMYLYMYVLCGMREGKKIYICLIHFSCSLHWSHAVIHSHGGGEPHSTIVPHAQVSQVRDRRERFNSLCD